MVAQLARTSLPGSQHNLLVTVDYGMDGTDYLNNVTVNATELLPATFNAVLDPSIRRSINLHI